MITCYRAGRHDKKKERKATERRHPASCLGGTLRVSIFPLGGAVSRSTKTEKDAVQDPSLSASQEEREKKIRTSSLLAATRQMGKMSQKEQQRGRRHRTLETSHRTKDTHVSGGRVGAEAQREEYGRNGLQWTPRLGVCFFFFHVSFCDYRDRQAAHPEASFPFFFSLTSRATKDGKKKKGPWKGSSPPTSTFFLRLSDKSKLIKRKGHGGHGMMSNTRRKCVFYHLHPKVMITHPVLCCDQLAVRCDLSLVKRSPGRETQWKTAWKKEESGAHGREANKKK